MTKQILLDFDSAQLTEYITQKYGVKPFVAKQIFGWLYKGAQFDDMTNISKNLRNELSQDNIAQSVEIIQILTSNIDGTQKMLYKLNDGNVIEGVLMKYKYGNTLCVSTQVGCRMGCKFCASTLNGLVRNLTAGEIIGQVVAVNAMGNGERYVDNIVLMGSGEPLDNYDNVIKFIKTISAPDTLNISQRNISLSTCGLVPQMERLAQEGLSINLTVSLHNARQEGRELIMPIAKQYSVSQVMAQCRKYFENTGRRVIIEYTLIDGNNDSYQDALALAHAVRNMSVHVNIIRLNPVKERKLHATTDKVAKKFVEYLTKLNVSATLRRQMGVDIDGACGQLRQKYLQTKESGN